MRQIYTGMSLRKLNFPSWSISITLLLLCLISYGLLANRLGYFWDDWPAIWFKEFYGTTSLIEVLGIDRPQLAWLYVLTTSLVGQSAFGWQLFAILTRWLSCLALWWLLVQVWPNNRMEVTWVTFLFAIYPGFRQQYIALIYSHDWIVISLFFISLGLMIAAFRKPRWFWVMMITSWILAAFAMFADEYYFGLEFLRPVLLWLTLKERFPERRVRLGKVLLTWLPYLAIMAVFLFWRLVLHVSPRGEVQIIEQISSQPLVGLANLGKTIALDVFESGLQAWSLPFRLNDIINSGITSIYVYVGMAVLVGGLMILFLERLEFIRQKADQTWAIQATFLGLLALLLGGWPFWATDWQIGLTFPWDRFNLAMNLGASLLVVGLSALIFRFRLLVNILLGVVIGFSSANAYHLAKQYQQDWDLLKSFVWQLSWRAPGIQEDTLLLTYRPPFVYTTDNSLTAVINWIYAPDNRTRQLPYLVWDVASHHPLGGWDELDPAQPFELDYRITRFQGSFGQALSVFFKPPDCLKVLDSQRDLDLPGRPLYITPGAAFSQIDRIQTHPEQPAQPPAGLFGAEPEPGWCYFYQKAELARQSGDWQTASYLADQALALGRQMSEANVLEWMPFIESYLNTGRINEAIDLSLQVHQVHPKMRRMICAAWDRAPATAAADPAYPTAMQRLEGTMACSARD